MSKATNDPWAPQSSIPRIAMPGGLDPMKLNMSSEEYIATLGENMTIKMLNYLSDIKLILPFWGGGRHRCLPWVPGLTWSLGFECGYCRWGPSR